MLSHLHAYVRVMIIKVWKTFSVKGSLMWNYEKCDFLKWQRNRFNVSKVYKKLGHHVFPLIELSHLWPDLYWQKKTFSFHPTVRVHLHSTVWDIVRQIKECLSCWIPKLYSAISWPKVGWAKRASCEEGGAQILWFPLQNTIITNVLC